MIKYSLKNRILLTPHLTIFRPSTRAFQWTIPLLSEMIFGVTSGIEEIWGIKVGIEESWIMVRVEEIWELN